MRVYTRRAALIVVLLTGALYACAQTNSVASGNWSDATVWSPGTVPGATTTANVNNPLVLDANISITTGTYTFNTSVTDLSGGTAYTLSMTGGSIDISSGTTTFEGAASLGNCLLTVRGGATLVLGALTKNNKCNILIEAGGTLIVNGTLNNNDNQGTFIIDGLVQVNGDYLGAPGSSSVTGTGDLYTNGFIFGAGSTEVFGSTVDCVAPQCSGHNLCGYANLVGDAQSVCTGSSLSTLISKSGGSPGVGATYKWQQSTTSNSTGFSDITGATSETYAPGILTQTTWFRRVVTKGGCTGISPPVKITIIPTGGWRGTTSGDWNIGSNWCGGSVPVSTTDVLIPPTGNGVTNSPTTSAAAVCHDLVIQSGAVVTIGGANSFAIYGNLTNNGTLTTNSSTVTLGGSSQQSISGVPITFYNLIIGNTSPTTVVVNSLLTTRNVLTMTTGNINLSGYNFTLGLSTGTIGSLSRTSGNFYNGYFTRWFNTSAIAVGASSGLFPVGTDADYRPFYVGHTGLTTGGSMRVSHVGASTATNVSFLDGASLVVRRNDSKWIVTKLSSLTPSSTVDLRVEATGLGTVTNVSDLRLTLAGSVVGTAGVNAGTVSNPQVNRVGVTGAQLNNTFYVSTSSILSPLPLTLVKFSGTYTVDGVLLEWRTVSEENFDHFLLERSSTGLEFEPIARISGKGGPTTAASYSQLDESAQTGRYYYRLKMIDVDESYTYSKVISVLTGDQARGITLYPNPVTGKRFVIILKALGATARLILYDQYGRTFVDEQLNDGENEILVNDLPGGVYFAKVTGMPLPMVVKVVVQ